MTTVTRPDIATNPYLAEYRAALQHQREHGSLMSSLPWEKDQAAEWCTECLTTGRSEGYSRHGVKRRYSWAIPDDAALDVIAQHSPNGVVEIGAGGGYWAGMLRSRGVDVVAYDPDPDGGPRDDGSKGWHDGTCWFDVRLGDHTAVATHSDRTLLLVWPSYGGDWTDQVIDLYDGDTVIYVGEGQGGCTGTDRMHALLGEEPYCWHDEDDEDCDCPKGVVAKFNQVATVDIPQWWGLHDRLYVYTLDPSRAGARRNPEGEAVSDPDVDPPLAEWERDDAIEHLPGRSWCGGCNADRGVRDDNACPVCHLRLRMWRNLEVVDLAEHTPRGEQP